MLYIFFPRSADATSTFARTFGMVWARSTQSRSTTLPKTFRRSSIWWWHWPTWGQTRSAPTSTKSSNLSLKSCRKTFRSRPSTTSVTLKELTLEEEQAAPATEDRQSTLQTCGPCLKKFLPIIRQRTTTWRRLTHSGTLQSFLQTHSGQLSMASSARTHLPRRDTSRRLSLSRTQNFVLMKVGNERLLSEQRWTDCSTFAKNSKRFCRPSTSTASAQSLRKIDFSVLEPFFKTKFLW